MGRSDPRIAVVGLGGVGRALLELIVQRRPPLQVVGVADSRGALAGDIDLQLVLKKKEAGGLDYVLAADELVATARPDVVVDLTACDFSTGEPALSLISGALEMAAHVVTANKSPLARQWRSLHEIADRRGVGIGFSAAAGAALPAVAVAAFLRVADRLTSFEGILTGTSAFVLSRMMDGASFEDAVAEAQAAGIAEPDPAIDLGGWDTAAKTVILANLLWEEGLELDDVEVTGVGPTTSVEAGGAFGLVGRAWVDGGTVRGRVGPRAIEAGHPLSVLGEKEKGVVFEGPSVGRVVVSGGRSHPRGAAAAVLSDVLTLGTR